MSGALPLPHLLLAVAVMAVWGTNFVVVRLALEDLPPLLLAALRYTFAFLPFAFFLKRPAVPWRHLAAYGVLIGVGQFGLMFIAMKNDISPGLASLVIQTQIFFTLALVMRMSGERLERYQWVALALAVSGLGLILMRTDGSATPLGIGLILLAAMGWAGGNVVARMAGAVDMLAYVVWASLFAAPPLMALSLLFDGAPAIARGLAKADLGTWAAVIWQAVGNTMFGYGAWGWLLARHPAGAVTPLALLVPVFGMGASAIVLHETLPAWKLAAAGLVLAGLALNMLWPTIRTRLRGRQTGGT